MSLPLDPEQVQAEVDAICALVAQGRTLRQIAAELGMSQGTILNRTSREPQHVEQYTRAREAAADIFETDILEAAQAVTAESATADRVKIDALKWVAARRAPKKYGDKITNEHTGAGGGPIQTVTRIELVALSDDSTDSPTA